MRVRIRVRVRVRNNLVPSVTATDFGPFLTLTLILTLTLWVLSVPTPYSLLPTP
jgi:hypothetical protein